MGDRCTVTITHLKSDSLGLVDNYGLPDLYTESGPLVQEEYDEINYAFGIDYQTPGYLPTNVPYFGRSGPGTEYPEAIFVNVPGYGFAMCDSQNGFPALQYSLRYKPINRDIVDRFFELMDALREQYPAFKEIK